MSNEKRDDSRGDSFRRDPVPGVESVVGNYFLSMEDADPSELGVVDAPTKDKNVSSANKSTHVDDSEEANSEDEESAVSALDDDEKWLRGDDVALSEDDDSAFLKQLDNTVSWRIEGLYNEKGKTRNQLYLRENPPLLIVESGNGEYVSFVLTKELTRTLSTSFDDLKKAYYGSGRKRGDARTFDDKVKGSVQWAKEEPLKASLTVFLFVSLLVLLFVI